MIEVRNKRFTGATVPIDGQKFIGCHFINCVFRWNGGPYEMASCAIEGFRGFVSETKQIADTVSLLKSFGLLEKEFAESWQRHAPVYVPAIERAS